MPQKVTAVGADEKVTATGADTPTVRTNLDQILPPPPKAGGESTVFPKRLPTLDEIGEGITRAVIGSAKGTGQTLVDLGKFTMNPASAALTTPFDFAREAYQPHGAAETIGSFAPDLLLGAGVAKAAGPRAVEAARGAAVNRWMQAADRPIAESPRRMAVDTLQEGVGRMTRPNVVRQAEIEATKAPTPRGRMDAFKQAQNTFNKAQEGPSVIGVPLPRGMNSRNINAAIAQGLYSSAPAMPYGVGGAVTFASMLSRLLGGGQ